MNIKEPNYWYGYDNFKKNIPIELEDIEVPLTLEDKHELNHNWSFLRMNADFIELIDQYYARLGKGFSVFFLLLPGIILVVGFIGYLFFIPQIDSNGQIDWFFVVAIFFILSLTLFGSIYPVYKYDKRKPICRPIIFNRNTQKVYFYINKQEYVEKHWLDVTYALGTSQGLGGMPIYELRAHIIEDGILKDTF